MTKTKHAADIFYAIADANRRKLLDLLAEGEKPVQELVTHFDISFAAISQHLRILYQVGLVARRPVGRQRFYRARRYGFRSCTHGRRVTNTFGKPICNSSGPIWMPNRCRMTDHEYDLHRPDLRSMVPPLT